MYNEAINLLKQVVAIPSLSGEEDQVCGFLKSWLEAKGLLVNREHNNIWVESWLGDDLPTILLNSHMDTVKPVNGWTQDPFLPEEKDGRLYGLGSSDAGGSMVSLIFAFLGLIKLTDRKYNLILLLSAEEENSGKNGLSSVMERFSKIDLAIVGEPTGLEMAVCERGLMVIDCTARGKAGHVAHRDGVNSILLAMEDIRKLYNLKFEKYSDFLGNVQLEVTQIQAGYQHNIVPDECRFVIDVRTNEHYSNEEIFGMIRDTVNCEVVPRSFRLRSSFIDPQHPLVVQARRLGISTFGSKTMSDQALIPFPSVKIGPGDSKLSHNADEYIEKDKVTQAIELYIKLLKDFKF